MNPCNERDIDFGRKGYAGKETVFDIDYRNIKFNTILR